MTRRDLVVHVVSVERTVAGKRRHRTSDLIEQRADLRAVIDVVSGQRG